MSSLVNLIEEVKVQSYFQSLEKEEIESRLLIYLEIFPWLLSDLLEILKDETLVDSKLANYKDLLKELRDKKDQVEIDVQ